MAQADQPDVGAGGGRKRRKRLSPRELTQQRISHADEHRLRAEEEARRKKKKEKKPSIFDRINPFKRIEKALKEKKKGA